VKPMLSRAYSPLRLLSMLFLCGLILCGAPACTTTPPRPAPAPVIQEEKPEPLHPGIKPLTVEEEEVVGG
jgi:hypothetical protein